MSAIGSLVIAVIAIVSASVLLGLHDLSAAEYLAVIAGAGIHIASIAAPASSSPSASTTTE